MFACLGEWVCLHVLVSGYVCMCRWVGMFACMYKYGVLAPAVCEGMVLDGLLNEAFLTHVEVVYTEYHHIAGIAHVQHCTFPVLHIAGIG